MSSGLIVALISGAVALASVLLSARATQRTAKLTHEFELQKARATKEQQVEEIMSRYREPLLRAAFDLQSRIYNILRQGFLFRYGGQGKEHEREYAVDNTLFLIGQYLSWIEILRRDVQFLDLGDEERNRLMVERLEAVARSFADDRKIKDRRFRIFAGDQRALGELMICTDDDTDVRRCMGYAQFRTRLHDDEVFAHWFQPLRDDVVALTAEESPTGERLTTLQHGLIDLIAFLDDPPRRFLPDSRTKL